MQTYAQIATKLTTLGATELTAPILTLLDRYDGIAPRFFDEHMPTPDCQILNCLMTLDKIVNTDDVIDLILQQDFLTWRVKFTEPYMKWNPLEQSLNHFLSNLLYINRKPSAWQWQGTSPESELIKAWFHHQLDAQECI